MRIGGTGESPKAVDEARDGFVGGAMPVGVVVAMAQYPRTIRVVVRPAAGAGNTGAGRIW
jgi:hypothetical protein